MGTRIFAVVSIVEKLTDTVGESAHSDTIWEIGRSFVSSLILWLIPEHWQVLRVLDLRMIFSGLRRAIKERSLLRLWIHEAHFLAHVHETCAHGGRI